MHKLNYSILTWALYLVLAILFDQLISCTTLALVQPIQQNQDHPSLIAQQQQHQQQITLPVTPAPSSSINGASQKQYNQQETSASQNVAGQQINRRQQAQQQPPQQQQPAQQQQPEQPQPDDEYLIGVGITDITGPSADINLVSLIGLIISSLASSASSVSSDTSSTSATTNYLNSLVQFQYPSWQEFQDVKLQFKINMNPLILRSSTPIVETLFRWGMPNRVRMQAEYTYANLVVQL